MSDLKSVNPFNGKVLNSYPKLSDQEIGNKINMAEKAFKHWGRASLQEKSSFMLNSSDYLSDNKLNLAETISLEMGKPITEAVSEIEKCAWVCRYYTHHASEHLKEEYFDTEAKKSFVKYEPLGIILAVMPWNFPFWQVFRFAAPTLMAGNVALLKHASNVPKCSLEIEKVFKESGFPDGVFQSLLIGSDQVEKVISNPGVKAATLTGSEVAGSSLASEAGKHIKKTVLELGGSDPFIVLDDADMDLAVEKAVTSRMINNGQSCIAAKRFIIVESKYEAFKDAIIQKVKDLKIGDPISNETKLGPLARPDLAKELWKQMQKSIEKGAKVELEGVQPKDSESGFLPVVLGDVKTGMPAFDEELFGPVFSLIRAKDEKHAIELANQSELGLGASIWTKNSEKALKLSGEIQAGCVFINELVKSDPRVPFGGIKKSGYGRELSSLGIKEFVNAKTVWLES